MWMFFLFLRLSVDEDWISAGGLAMVAIVAHTNCLFLHILFMTNYTSHNTPHPVQQHYFFYQVKTVISSCQWIFSMCKLERERLTLYHSGWLWSLLLSLLICLQHLSVVYLVQSHCCFQWPSCNCQLYLEEWSPLWKLLSQSENERDIKMSIKTTFDEVSIYPSMDFLQVIEDHGVGVLSWANLSTATSSTSSWGVPRFSQACRDLLPLHAEGRRPWARHRTCWEGTPWDPPGGAAGCGWGKWHLWWPPQPQRPGGNGQETGWTDGLI